MCPELTLDFVPWICTFIFSVHTHTHTHTHMQKKKTLIRKGIAFQVTIRIFLSLAGPFPFRTVNFASFIYVIVLCTVTMYSTYSCVRWMCQGIKDAVAKLSFSFTHPHIISFSFLVLSIDVFFMSILKKNFSINFSSYT